MSKLRILIVDDEEELVGALVERLQLRGMEAHGVTSGAEALVFIQTTELDVVLLDMKMPGLGGLQVVKKIKAEKPQLQVVLLTGHGSAEDAEKGIECGAFDCLMKPIKIEELCQVLGRAAGCQEPPAP